MSQGYTLRSTHHARRSTNKPVLSLSNGLALFFAAKMLKMLKKLVFTCQIITYKLVRRRRIGFVFDFSSTEALCEGGFIFFTAEFSQIAENHNINHPVIPAKAGIHFYFYCLGHKF